MSSHFAANAASRLRRTQQPTSRSTSAAGHHPHHHISGTSSIPASNFGALSHHQHQTSMAAPPAPQAQSQLLQPQQQSSTSTTSVRRNLFKTLRTASTSIAGAGSRATKQYLQPSNRRRVAAETPADAVFDDQDIQIKEEEDDILEKGPDGQWLINLPEMDEMIDDEEEDEEREQLRLADLVRQHARSDLTRHLPELLRLQVQSLQEDCWMYEEEDAF